MRRRGSSQRGGSRAVRLLVCVSLFAVWIAGVLPAQATPPWTIETVESFKGIYTSLKIDSAGHPHISYIDQDSATLKYATRDDTGWHTKALYDIEIPAQTSLALDPAGHPHISFYNGHTDQLMYASFDGNDWSYEVADPTPDVDVGTYSSLAIDPSGNPHISYYDNTNHALKYTVRDSGNWTAITVDSGGDVGEYTSLALEHGPNHYPHISYYDVSRANLKHAYLDCTGWHTEIVDANPEGAGKFTSLAIDSNDRPRIVYTFESRRELGFAYLNDRGFGWIHSVIEGGIGPGVESGMWLSLVIDGNDHPHVSYYGDLDHQLKYAFTVDDSVWRPHVVDDDGDEGEYSSLALDASGKPHISYYSSEYHTLRYASLNDTTPPVVSASATNADGSTYTFGGWTNQSVKVTLSANDDASGVSGIFYGLSGPGGTEPTHNYAQPFTVSSEGTTTITYWATDNADNTAESQTTTVKIDLTKPTVDATATTRFGASYTSGVWTSRDVRISLTASDAGGSGLDKIFYQIGTGAPIVFDDAFTISTEGTTPVVYWSTDNAGNESTHQTLTVNIDRTPPTISGAPTTNANANGWYNAPVTIHWTCSDTFSSVASCPPDSTISTEGTNQTISGTATDVAGNSVTVASAPAVNLDLTAPVVTYSGNQDSYDVDETIEISCQASDNLSGIDTTTCADISVPASSVTPGPHTLTATATDLAGNTGSASVTFTVAATPESLCTLTQDYVGQAFGARLFCMPLSIVSFANAIHNPRLKAVAVDYYLALLRTQVGHTLTDQEYATLADAAHQL